MQSGAPQRLVDLLGGDEAGRPDVLAGVLGARSPRAPARARGRRRRRCPRSPGIRRAAAATPATTAGARFSGIMRPANTTTGSAARATRGLQRAGVLALEHGHLAAQPLLRAGARRAGARSRRRCWGTRAQARCTACPIASPDPAEVLAPVGAAPHLVPVDDEPVAPERPQQRRPPAARSRGRRRCARPHSGGRGAAGARSTPSPKTSGGRIRRRPPSV